MNSKIVRQTVPFQLGTDENASFAQEKIDRIAQIMRGANDDKSQQ